MRTRHQLIRFTGVAALVFVLNYAFMKFLLEVIHLYPTVSRIIASGTVATLSFVMHNVFTFKTKGTKPKAA
jgi:putative flippase GtrA